MKKVLLFTVAIGFIGSARSQTIVGADMETWVSYSSVGMSMNRPAGWISTDSLTRVYQVATGSTSPYTPRIIQSTTIKNAGLSSARLIASSTDSLPVILSNSDISFNVADLLAGKYNFKYTGGTNVTARIVTVNAYLHHPLSPDTSLMQVMAFKNGYGAGGADSMVGSGNLDIISNSGFVKMSANLTYVNTTIIPDRLVIAFVANKNLYLTAQDTLYVDDVTISDPTGIETPLVNDPSVKAFPNPAINTLHISAAVNDELVVDFYNVLGQKMMSQKMKQEADINVAALTAGNYTFVVTNFANGHKFFSGIFTKQ